MNMSDSQAYEEVRLSSDGVAVTKRFEEDEFPVPAIAFEFASDREESVMITLTDEVPEGVAVEDLGFHPEYGSEYWTIDDDQITFEKDLDANSEYTTVYGIRATGTDDVEQFLTEPGIDEVDPPLPKEDKADTDDPDEDGSEDIIPETDNNVVKDVISGEGDVPGLEDDDDADDEEIETLNLKDPNQPDSVGGGNSANSEETSDGETTAVDLDGDSVVATIAEEIRQNEVAIDDLKLVTRAIDKLSERNDGGSSSGGAQDARVDKLQKDIADLRAYTDALEEFLDENGTGEQLIRDFESQLDNMSDSLDQVEAELAKTSDTVDGVRDGMEEVTSEVDSVADDVDSVESTVEDLEKSLEGVESAVDELEAEVTDGDVAGRLEDIEADIEGLQEWQEQIKNTFGG
jgi:archaellum component FlaC